MSKGKDTNINPKSGRVEFKDNAERVDIAVLLHDIRSVYNVGSMFRTSDAVGVSKIYLSGTSPTPLDRFGNKRKDLAKVALGAEDYVPWEQIEDPLVLIKKLRKEGYKIIAVEQSSEAVDYKEIKIDGPTLFVFGNEVDGVVKDILKEADIITEIPMRGDKESLNVSVSFGIAMFRILNI